MITRFDDLDVYLFNDLAVFCGQYVIPNLARWGTRVLRRMLTCKTGGRRSNPNPI